MFGIKMKLSTKIWMGFILLIAIIGIVGFMSWNGVNEIVFRVDNGDDANRLVKFVYQARIQRDSYVAHKDQQSQDNLAKLLTDIREQIEETKGQLRELVDKNRMDQLKNEVDAYERNFKAYVKNYEENTAPTRQTMINEADAFVLLCDQMEEKQSQDMANAVAQEADAETIENEQQQVNDALALKEMAYQARIIEKNFQIYHEKSYITEMDNHMKAIFSQIETAKSKLKLQEDRDLYMQLQTEGQK
ncbi:MAG: methyl-accepting chemotaxis protein, partial [Thermotogota bacterium]